MSQRRSVAIIGTGNVGVAAAYALFNQRTASEIILVDINEEKARGEADGSDAWTTSGWKCNGPRRQL